jgi:hypothetical protein
MRRALRAILLLLFAAPCLVAAHETLIGVLQLKETQPGSYIATWNFQSDRGVPAPTAVFPEHCRYESPRLECGERGLSGTITVEDLGKRYSGVVIQLSQLNRATRSYTLTGAQPNLTLSADGTVGWAQAAIGYVPLGFEHIMLGVDHLLFVLGLMWLVSSTWMLVKTITAFTVAHSLTLAAVTLGWLGVPERPVNAVIALSIVFVAVEVVKRRRGQVGLTVRYPWVVAFAFGLLHGFGFAGALTKLGLPPDGIPAALLFFNIGVELGQLAFVLIVLALGWAHRTLEAQLPRWSAALPVYGVGTLATVWFCERLVMMIDA